MAGLTKEQRELKQTEADAQLRSELELKIRKELESEYKNNLSTKENKTTIKATRTKKKIPLDTMIPCRSGVQGILVYVSKKIIGYSIEWDAYGSVEYLELSELLSMKNTSKSFYVNNWIFFEDTEEYSAVDIYEFLEVTKYFENAIIGEDLDNIFLKTPKEITKIVSKLSRGIKDTIAAKARILIDAKELDSTNRIEALEEALDVELKPNYGR